MKLEIKPEPRPEEREAIEAALRRLVDGGSTHPAYASSWRQSGIRQAVEAQAAARPRRSLGATRA